MTKPRKRHRVFVTIPEEYRPRLTDFVSRTKREKAGVVLECFLRAFPAMEKKYT